MAFVADEIPSELKRVVEFLNEQMDPAEVLAVEIKQYIGQGLKTLVPRVMGQTAEAQRKKSGTTSETKHWDESSFFQELETRRGKEEGKIAREILEWAKANSLRIWWGKGNRSGSFFPMLDYNGLSHWLISVWTYGSIEVQFQMMKSKPHFDDESKRMELVRRLNEIPGVIMPVDAIARRPIIPLSDLKDMTILKQFLNTLNWVVQEIKAS